MVGCRLYTGVKKSYSSQIAMQGRRNEGPSKDKKEPYPRDSGPSSHQRLDEPPRHTTCGAMLLHALFY